MSATTSLPVTYFAPPERTDPQRLQQQACKLRAAPFVRELLDSIPDPVVILNSQRHIVLLNEAFGQMLGRPAEEVLGLRLGEAFRCHHAFDEPAGCGTTRFCQVCGAAQAMVRCQQEGTPEVEECRILRAEGLDPCALDLRVWARPLRLDDETFIVFAIRDISDEKRRTLLERMFFHDVLNAASGLHGLLGIWPELQGEDARETEEMAQHLAEHLMEEIEIQRDLAAAERGDLLVESAEVDVGELLEQLCGLYRYHLVAHGKTLAAPRISGPTTVWTSSVLLRRVVGNLIKNALEASRTGQTVTVSFTNEGTPTIAVHNESVMPENVQLQMFQRSFSTKGSGRGVGSYSVKLLTERYLGGSVAFESRPGAGTTFFIRLPASNSEANRTT